MLFIGADGVVHYVIIIRAYGRSGPFYAPPVKVSTYPLYHPFGFFKDHPIFKAKESNALRFNKEPFRAVVHRWAIRKVSFAVEFDGQSFGRAVEIVDKVSDALLPPKFPAV